MINYRNIVIIAAVVTSLFIAFNVSKETPTPPGALVGYALSKPIRLRTKPRLGCMVGDLDSIEHIARELRKQYLLVTLESFRSDARLPIASKRLAVHELRKSRTTIDLQPAEMLLEDDLGLYICTASIDDQSCRQNKPIDMAEIATKHLSNPDRPLSLGLEDQSDRVIFFQYLNVKNGVLRLPSAKAGMESRAETIEHLTDHRRISNQAKNLILQTSSLPLKVIETSEFYQLELILPGYHEEYCRRIVRERHQDKVEKYRALHNKFKSKGNSDGNAQ